MKGFIVKHFICTALIIAGCGGISRASGPIILAPGSSGLANVQLVVPLSGVYNLSPRQYTDLTLGAQLASGVAKIVLPGGTVAPAPAVCQQGTNSGPLVYAKGPSWLSGFVGNQLGSVGSPSFFSYGIASYNSSTGVVGIRIIGNGQKYVCVRGGRTSAALAAADPVGTTYLIEGFGMGGYGNNIYPEWGTQEFRTVLGLGSVVYPPISIAIQTTAMPHQTLATGLPASVMWDDPAPRQFTIPAGGPIAWTIDSGTASINQDIIVNRATTASQSLTGAQQSTVSSVAGGYGVLSIDASQEGMIQNSPAWAIIRSTSTSMSASFQSLPTGTLNIPVVQGYNVTPSTNITVPPIASSDPTWHTTTVNIEGIGTVDDNFSGFADFAVNVSAVCSVTGPVNFEFTALNAASAAVNLCTGGVGATTLRAVTPMTARWKANGSLQNGPWQGTVVLTYSPS